jgi:hypothetical protein
MSVLKRRPRCPGSRPCVGVNEKTVQTHDELLELAKICLLEAQLTTSRDVASEMLRMAKEYQRKAAKLGNGKMTDSVRK